MKTPFLVLLALASLASGCGAPPATPTSPSPLASATQAIQPGGLVGRWEHAGGVPRGYLELTTNGNVGFYTDQDGKPAFRGGTWSEPKPGKLELTYPAGKGKKETQSLAYEITAKDELVLREKNEPERKFTRMGPSGSGMLGLIGVWDVTDTREPKVMFEFTDRGTIYWFSQSKDGTSAAMLATYTATPDELVMMAPGQPPAPAKLELEGDKLTLSGGKANQVIHLARRK